MTHDLTTLQKAFPDYPVESIPLIPGFMWDSSWHNDTCPSFSSDDEGYTGFRYGSFGLQAFCDYAEPAKREFADAPRYSLNATNGAEPATLVASDNWADIQAAIIGFEFVRIIREWFSPEEFAEMQRRNKTPQYQGGACASHDFCDANEAMAEAFESVMGRPALTYGPDGELIDTQEDSDLWNQAWSFARAHGLEDDFQPFETPAPAPTVSKVEYRQGGELVTMSDGAAWFHPYTGAGPIRLHLDRES